MTSKAAEVNACIPSHDHKDTKVKDEEIARIVVIRKVRVGDNVAVKHRIVVNIFMLASKETHISFKCCRWYKLQLISNCCRTVSDLPESKGFADARLSCAVAYATLSLVPNRGRFISSEYFVIFSTISSGAE